MGKKGSKLSEHATAACDQLVASLDSLGNVASRKMFGGYGVFQEEKMFALITSEGIVHFKVADRNRQQYEDAGAAKFGRMPYYEVPRNVLKSHEELITWARESIAVAHGA